jgi:hypothetical protein
VRRLVFVTLLTACVVAACADATAETSTSRRHHEPVRAVWSAPPVLVWAQIGDLERAVEYVAAADRGRVSEFLTAVADGERTASTRTVGSSGPVGACGGATNGADVFISRESGGDPGVYNAGGSGAWGCYQLMPEHFATGGACSDMVYGAASPAQQAECASRLPLSAWGG